MASKSLAALSATTAAGLVFRLRRPSQDRTMWKWSRKFRTPMGPWISRYASRQKRARGANDRRSRSHRGCLDLRSCQRDHARLLDAPRTQPGRGVLHEGWRALCPVLRGCARWALEKPAVGCGDLAVLDLQHRASAVDESAVWRLMARASPVLLCSR